MSGPDTCQVPQVGVISRRQALHLMGAGSLAVALMSPGSASGMASQRRFAIDTLVPDSSDVDFARVFAAGMTGAVVDLDGYPRTRANAGTELRNWVRREANGAPIKIIKHATDFEQALIHRKLAIVLGSQDAAILETPGDAEQDRFDTLKTFYDLGLRVLQLTYNDRNSIGDGYWEQTDVPLSLYGRHLIAAMNELGVLIDLSHCGDTTTLEAIARSSKPVAVTHAGCRALFDNPRNKTDATIRKLAEKGGYFGIFNMTLWMTDATSASVATIVDHMEHAINVGGIDLVGFGNDHGFFGEQKPQAQWVADMTGWATQNSDLGRRVGLPPKGHVMARDLNGPDRLERIADELAKRRYSASAIDKILGLNFIRAFEAACG